jgi:hypothetical protein
MISMNNMGINENLMRRLKKNSSAETTAQRCPGKDFASAAFH